MTMGLGVASAANLDEVITFDIPVQNLDAALVQFSRQANVQVTSAAEQLRGLTAGPVVGRYRIPDALKLLLRNSGLSYRSVGDSAISIVRAVSGQASRAQLFEQPAAYQTALNTPGQPRPDAPAGQHELPVAAAPETPQLEEVVVRARKRTENLQEVPLSITAFNAGEIENFGFRNVQDIAYAVPNFTWGRLTTISEIICIRGICSDSSAPGFDTSIAVILDDVYIGRASGFASSLIDVDRIEVLRGPQGTLQGRNATGGAINIATTRPTDELHAMADLSYGNYNQVVAQAAISGPIFRDTLAGKLAVSRRSHDGFETNTDLDKPLDTEDSYALRGQLSYKPFRDLEVLLTGDYDHFNNHDFHNAYGPPDVSEPPPEFFTRKVGGNIQNYGTREIFGGAMNVYWTLPNQLQVVSVSSYRGFRVKDVQDSTGMRNFGAAGAGSVLGMAREDEDQRQFTQELRLVSPARRGFSWLAGLYYYWERLHDYQNYLYGFNTGTVVNGAAYIDDALMNTNSIGAFGSTTWDLNSFWSVTVGARLTRNSRHIAMTEQLGIDGTATEADGSTYTYVNMPTDANPVPQVFQAAVVYPTNRNTLTNRKSTGDLTITQHWREGVSTYLRYAHGFKGGGFNANFNNGFGAGIVKPELIDSFEAGVRSEFFDRRLRVNATGFYVKQKDQQILVYDTGLNLYVTSNAPSTESYGGEFDISGAVTRNLTLSLEMGITNAHFKAGPWSGNLVPYTSPVSITGVVQYTYPINDRVELFSFLNANWRGGYYTSPDDQPVSHQKSYVWLDGRIGIQASSGRWSLGFYDRNALDTNVLTFGLNNPGVYSVGFIAEPRTIGIDFRVKY